MSHPVLRTSLAALAVVLAGCQSSFTNQYDPNSEGPKADGQIAGRIYIEGASTQAGVNIQILDDSGAVADEVTTPDATGDFISAEIGPGLYSLTVDVPLENAPIELANIEVDPGVTRDVGLLVSSRLPDEGTLSGQVVLLNAEDGTEPEVGLQNVHVQAVRTRGDGGTETYDTFTNADGSFRFSELPPGSYDVSSQREGYTPDFASGISVDAPSRAVDAVLGESLKMYPASAVVRFSVPQDDGSRLDGAPYSKRTDVYLLLLAFGGVNEMRVSSSPTMMEGGAEVAWEDHLAEKAVVLSDAEGQKTLYAQFRLLQGAVERLRSDVYSAQIILDQTPPVVTQVIIDPTATEAGGVRYLKADATAVPVSVQALDVFAGVSAVKVVADGTDPALAPYINLTSTGSTIVYSTTVALSTGDGVKDVVVQLRDRASNETALSTHEITVDTSPPALLVASGEHAVVPVEVVGTFLTTQSPTLRILVGDDASGDGPVRMRYGLSAATLGTWTPFQSLVTVALASPEGSLVQFFAEIEDAAGNAVAADSALYEIELSGSIAGFVFLEGEPESGNPALTGSVIDIFDLAADIATDIPVEGGIHPDTRGFFTSSDDLVEGLYKVVVDNADYVMEVVSPVEVHAARSTDIGLRRLTVERGDIDGYFRLEDLAQDPSAHGGIVVEALSGAGIFVTATTTNPAGYFGFQDLPVGSYTFRATYDGYAQAEGTGTVLADALVSISTESAPLTLPTVTGDFKICDTSGTDPIGCAAIAYTNKPDVLLGFTTPNPGGGNTLYVRYAVDLFGSPAGDHTTDACPGAPAPDCWHLYTAGTTYRIPIDANGEGRVTLVAQFQLDDDPPDQVQSSSVIYDVTAPAAPSLDLEHAGTSTAIPGFTNQATMRLQVSATADPAGVGSGNVAPLGAVYVSPSPSSWNDQGGGGGVAFSSPGEHSYTFAAPVQGTNTLWAWFCDRAGNCTPDCVLGNPATTCANATVSASIVYDTVKTDLSTPGVSRAPSGPGITVAVPGQHWYTRSQQFSLALDLGDTSFTEPLSGLPIPHIVAYQISLSQQLVGAEWISIDYLDPTVGLSVVAPGVALPFQEVPHPLYLRFRDPAGNVSGIADALDFILELDLTSPSGLVSIDPLNPDSTVYEDDPTDMAVTVAASGADWMQFAWDGGSFSAQQIYEVAPTGWELGVAGDGAHTLTVRLLDDAGNLADLSAGIVVDQTPPLDAAAASCISCFVDAGVQAGVAYYSGDVVNLSLFGTDAQSGIARTHAAITHATEGASDQYQANYSPFWLLTPGLSDGVYGIEITFIDAAGNEQATPVTLSLHRDNVPPTGSLSIEGGAAYVSSRSVTLSLSAADAGGSGVTGMALADGSSLNCADATYQAFAPNFSWALPSGSGGKSVTVCYRDRAGNTAFFTDSVELDQGAPTGVSVTVQGAGAYVTSLTGHTIDITATDTQSAPADLQYQLSTDPTFSGQSTWQNLGAGGTAQLTGFAFPSGPEGQRSLFVRVRDLAGNVTAASTTVVYDGSAPAGGAITLAGGAAYTTTRTGITATLTAVDTVSGLYQMSITTTLGGPGSCVQGSWGTPFAGSTTIDLAAATEGIHTVCAWIRDAALNVAGPFSDEIFYDGTAPAAPSVTLTAPDTGSSTHTHSATVLVTTSTSDGAAGSGVTEMAIQNGAACSSSWRAFVGDLTWTLEAGSDGSKSVAVCVRDAAGNTTATPATATIVLDRVPPAAVALILDGGAAYDTNGSIAVQVAATDTTSTALDYLLKTQSTLDPATDVWVTGVATSSFPVIPAASPINAGEGSYYGYLWVRDRAGNTTSAAASIVVDTIAPTIDSVRIREDAGSGVTASSSVTLEITATGAAALRVSGNITGGNTWVSFTSLVTVDLDTSTNGTKSITVEVRDLAGNTPAAGAEIASIVYDSAAAGGSFQINAGATVTNSSTVVLDLVSADAVQIALTNASSIACASETRTPFETPITWNIGTGEGTKYVAICFYDAAGNSSSVTRQITLDTSAPDSLTLSLTGSTGSASGYTRDAASVTAAIHGSDATATLGYQLTLGPIPQSTWTSVAETTLDAGITGLAVPALNPGNEVEQTVYLHVRDAAGNVATTSASIIVDTVAPLLGTPLIIEVVSTPAGHAVGDAVVTLELFALDAYEVEVTGDVAADVPWGAQAFDNNVGIDLSSGDGTKSVAVRVRDAAYNVSASSTATVLLDGTAPTSSAITLTGRDRLGDSTAVTGITTVTFAVSSWADAGGTGIHEYQISEDSNFAGAPWVEPQGTLSFVVSAGDGTKTVYVRARDYVENVSASRSDAIPLDQTPPDAIAAIPDESYSSDRTFGITLDAEDAVSAQSSLQIMIRPPGSDADPSTEGIWMPWTSSLTFTIRSDLTNGGSAKASLSVRDVAGNQSTFPFIAPVIYDATDPTDPTLAFVKPLNRGALLSWSQSTDNITGGVASYEIEFGEPSDASDCTTVDGATSTYTVPGTDASTLLFEGDDGTLLRNKRQYCFRLRSVDLSGRTSNWTSWSDVAVGWTVLPVVSSATAVLVPQGIAYHQGKIFLLYHEQTTRSGFNDRIASTAKLAISEDGGDTWRISLVELPAGDPSFVQSGAVPGRVRSELTIGNRGISVITVDWACDSCGNLLALVDYYSEDEGLTWKRAVIDGSVGAGDFAEFPLAVAGTGSSRTIGYTRAIMGSGPVNLEFAFKRSSDDVRDQSSGAQGWWEDMGLTGVVFRDPGRHITACNANYVDRFMMTIPNTFPNPITSWRRMGFPGTYLDEGMAWSMVSPFHGNRWEPPNPGPGFGILDPELDIVNAPGWDYRFAELACVGLKDVAWAYTFATVSNGSTSDIRLKVRTQEFDGFSDRPTFISDTSDELGLVLWQPWATGVDSATPMAAWAGINKVYAIYRDTSGNAVVRIGTNTPFGKPLPDGAGTCAVTDPFDPNPAHDRKACLTWVTNYIDQSGDAAYNPVITGYNNASPLVAYTDNFGSQIKIARAALMAPQTVASATVGQVKVTWGDTAGTRNYDVLEIAGADATCGGGTTSTFGTTDTQVQTSDEQRYCYRIQAVDDNGRDSDAGRAWQALAFEETTVVAETSTKLFEDYVTPEDCQRNDGDAAGCFALGVACFWDPGTSRCLEAATTLTDCHLLDFTSVDMCTIAYSGSECVWDAATRLCNPTGAQTGATTITSHGAAVAAIGDVVAVLPPLRDRVNLYRSADNGESWTMINLYSSSSPLAYKRLKMTHRDVNADGVPEVTYIHVVHETNPTPTMSSQLLYNRISYAGGTWTHDIVNVPIDQAGGRSPDIAVRDDILAIAWVMNVPPGAPYAARVQLRGDHGAQPFAEGVLDTLESNGCGELDMLACTAETPRCNWMPACEPVAQCAPLGQSACMGTTGCSWFGECLWRTDCSQFPQSLCESQPDCRFTGSACEPNVDCRSYVGPAGCGSNAACYWKQGCHDTQDCSAFTTPFLCNGFVGCVWDGLCQASVDPSDCSTTFSPDDCYRNAECFWDGSANTCIAASGTTTVSGPIQNISIADVDVRDHDNVRVFTYFVQETGGGDDGDEMVVGAEDAVILSAELTFNVNPAQCEGLDQPSCNGLAPTCSWNSALGRCAKIYPVQGQGTAYKMCLPGECKKAKLISGARNSQFFTVFSAGEGGELFGDPRIQVSLASERVADLQSIDSSDATFAIEDGGGLWTRANLSSNEQVVLFSSLATVSDPFGLDGIWAVYSTCSNLGLNTVWKLNLAYCQSGCQAMENWTVNVVKTQAGIAGYECSGEWFGAMDIALDPIDKELYISYFADTDGTLGTGINDSDSYVLLRSGFLSIVEDQASIVGE